MAKAMSLTQWWKENKLYVYVGSSILFFIIIISLKYFYPEWFDSTVNAMNEIQHDIELQHRSLNIPSKRSKTESKGEIECKRAAEKIFNKPFKKIRPDFLKSELTGKNLEIDIYNDDLKIGIEFDGQQHFKYTPHFHRNGELDFQKQLQRDKFKEEKCKEHGIRLIRVPYLVKQDEIEGYIRVKARELGIIDN
jgi:hypothetical protein